MTSMTIRFDDALYEQARAKASAEHKNFTQFVRDAVRAYMNRALERPSKSKEAIAERRKAHEQTLAAQYIIGHEVKPTGNAELDALNARLDEQWINGDITTDEACAAFLEFVKANRDNL